MEGKGGLGGQREDRTEWTHLLPPPTASPTPIPRNTLLVYTPEGGESANALFNRVSHLPLVIEPQISALHTAAQTPFPKAEKTLTSAHSHCPELDTASPQSREWGRKGNLWNH